MRQILDEAAAGGYGVGAFNVNNMEQIQSIMEAARETGFPLIIQASRGARKYTNDRFLYHLMMAAIELYPDVTIALHQDHGNSPETCKSAIEMGFTSVMMDGSLMADGKTPANFEYNVQVTRHVVEMAHGRGVTVEGELGCLGSLETGEGTARKGFCRTTSSSQIRNRQWNLLSEQALMRSQWRSGQATVRTNLPENPMATCLLWIESLRFINCFRILIS